MSRITTEPWPTSREFVEAVQNPGTCFTEPELRSSVTALDKLGMPLVTSGQFAYVFKLNGTGGRKAQAVRCFRGLLGDRAERYGRISDHLEHVSVPQIADFEYDPAGILVGGRKYPTVVMEWIEGQPLDVYISRFIGKADEMKSLAGSWLKILAALKAGGIAHGDLQHGNVIIDPGNSIRLVDLDGLYVPSMKGWKSAEVGHRHYQHPKRNRDHFGPALDNFSGLVIYLSLIALVTEPALWSEYHDENLIFTASDFGSPASSKLFQIVKKIGTEQQRLAEALENGCNSDDPLKCPSVLDLVAARASKWRVWMWPSLRRKVDQATPEAKTGSPVSTGTQASQGSVPSSPPLNTSARWWKTPHSTGTTSPKTTIQSKPSSRPIPAGNLAALIGATAKHALNYAFIGVFPLLGWFVLEQSLSDGNSSAMSAWLRISVAFGTVCVAWGYRKAKKEFAASTTTMTVGAASSGQTSRSPSVPPPGTPGPMVTISQTGPLVGHRIRFIYHQPTCKSATKISSRNRVNFTSATDARAAGYKQCSVCTP